MLTVVTESSPTTPLRDRLYRSYASQHAGRGGSGTAHLIYRRDIRPLLPSPEAGPIVNIGCGQGELVRLLLGDGYQAEGIDVSPEQVAIAHAAGLDRVRLGDYRDLLSSRTGQLAAVTATDVLEHLTKAEAVDTFDCVAAALAPDGVFVARVPNAVSPFAGRIQHGDFTHESWYTARSVRKLAVATCFESVTVLPCAPVAHGLVSAVRVVIWASAAVLCKIVLAAETGAARGHIVTQNLTFAARKAG